MEESKLSICPNHVQPFMYTGTECPWCTFAAEVVNRLQAEYKRGFGDGVRAADMEYKKEAERVKRSNDSKEPTQADVAVSGDVPKKQ
jgi:glutaredoxin